jgi:biotin carboxyl carrier protein
VPVVADREDRLTWLLTVGPSRVLATVADAAAGIVMIRPAGVEEGSSDRPTQCQVSRLADRFVVRIGADRYEVRRAPPPTVEGARARQQTGGTAMLQAPMPGRIVKVAVAVGDEVVERQPLVVVEAMKIESAIVAPRAGVVSAVLCVVGEAVAGGQVLVELAST